MFRIFKYFFKDIVLEFGATFWMVVYPIILSTLFYFALSGPLQTQSLNIRVAVSEQSEIVSVLSQIDGIHVTSVADDAQGQALVRDKTVEAYINAERELFVYRSDNLATTVLRTVLNQVEQAYALGTNAMHLDFDWQTVDKATQEKNALATYYFVLVAMVSMYAIFGIIGFCEYIQANLSQLGLRLNQSPLKKSTFVMAGVLTTFVVNLVSNFALVLFINYVLGLNIFVDFWVSLALILLGNLFGIAFGAVIGSMARINTESKTMMSVGFTLFLGGISGLFSVDIKFIAEQALPFIKYINPVTLISDALYQVNILGQYRSVLPSVLTLAGMSVVLIVGAIFSLRGKRYDSV